MTTSALPTLAARVLPRLTGTTRPVVMAIAGSLALWASAKVQVPFYPVPMTFQTFVVLAIGMAYGARLGAATVLLYLLEGAVGLPVFAGTPDKGLGLAYMMGPTGGYLLGYLLAAATTGFLAERGFDRRPATTALAMLAGNVALYVPGLLWLGAVIGWEKPVLTYGLTPFLTGDVLKLALATALFPVLWSAGRAAR